MFRNTMISKLFRDVPLPVAGTGIMGNGGFDNKKVLFITWPDPGGSTFYLHSLIVLFFRFSKVPPLVIGTFHKS